MLDRFDRLTHAFLIIKKSYEIVHFEQALEFRAKTPAGVLCKLPEHRQQAHRHIHHRCFR